MLEIRILSGARAGQVDRFDKPVVSVGRHAVVDLRFSPEKDLDVSGRHAEIRHSEGKYTLHDMGSTNGTFVNGRKVDGHLDLHDGDKVKFGANGPEAEIRTNVPGVTSPPPRMVRTTEERIAVAVSEQTAGIKRYTMAAILVVILGSGGMYAWSNMRADKRAEDLQKRLAISDSMAAILQGGTRGDTALLNRLVQMDLPAIHKQNSPAVALLVSEINGKSFAGSGFAITPEGVIVTNRHNVQDSSGTGASRLAVKFTNRGDWLPAHVLTVSTVPGEDLALIQMDRGGPFPVVAGISSGATGASEGNSVVTLGFPLGYDTPMEGEGNAFIAKSTLNPGTVSKRTSTVLQIDSYAAHGSSGSPVFNTRGLVIGVVWGGPPDGGGRIVYAVPPDRLAAFIPAEYRSVVKD